MLPNERKQRRQHKLESLLLAEISDMLLEDIKDPRCVGVVIGEVRLAKDLSSAVVLVRARSGGEDVTEHALPALNHASAYIRRELGARLSLRRVPTLKFVADLGIVYSTRVTELLNKLSSADRCAVPKDGENNEDADC